jgi:hypothetical protein
VRRRLERDDLFKSSTDGLERLAVFLHIELPEDKVRMTVGQYRSKLINAIQRAEKQQERAPRETR